MNAPAAHDLLIRAASLRDIPVLEALIQASARALGHGFYSDAETEAAIKYVFGVDSELVRDGTYLIAEANDGAIMGCGGWSKRRTMFGGDNFVGRSNGLLDPAEDAARIRAFFVAPGVARTGVASRLLAACERQAFDAGFGRMALMATLPGVPFYAARGYAADKPVYQPCGERSIRFVPMHKAMEGQA